MEPFYKKNEGGLLQGQSAKKHVARTDLKHYLLKGKAAEKKKEVGVVWVWFVTFFTPPPNKGSGIH